MKRIRVTRNTLCSKFSIFPFTRSKKIWVTASLHQTNYVSIRLTAVLFFENFVQRKSVVWHASSHFCDSITGRWNYLNYP